MKSVDSTQILATLGVAFMLLSGAAYPDILSII